MMHPERVLYLQRVLLEVVQRKPLKSTDHVYTLNR